MKNKFWSLGLAACLTTAAVGVLSVGCAGNKYEQSTGEYIDDKGTTSRVKSALAEDPQYKYEEVNVTTFKGTVQLSGFVNNKGQKEKAEEIAKTIPGVKDVVNNITVKE